jgi:hypothetical protein
MFQGIKVECILEIAKRGIKGKKKKEFKECNPEVILLGGVNRKRTPCCNARHFHSGPCPEKRRKAKEEEPRVDEY